MGAVAKRQGGNTVREVGHTRYCPGHGAPLHCQWTMSGGGGQGARRQPERGRHRYRAVTLPSVAPNRNWGIMRVWPSYTTALAVNGQVLVPIYRDPERDAAALAVYRPVMPDHGIIGIDASITANAGSTVDWLTMQIPAYVISY
jgi:hypothetical protein